MSQLLGGSRSDSGRHRTVELDGVLEDSCKRAPRSSERCRRDLSGEDVVALFLDGKKFAESTMVVALWRKRLQKAYNLPEYEDALAALE